MRRKRVRRIDRLAYGAFLRFTVADAAAQELAEGFVGVRPFTLREGPDLHLDAASGQVEPDVHRSVSAVRGRTHIFDFCSGSTEVFGDFFRKVRLLCQDHVGVHAHAGKVLHLTKFKGRFRCNFWTSVSNVLVGQ